MDLFWQRTKAAICKLAGDMASHGPLFCCVYAGIIGLHWIAAIPYHATCELANSKWYTQAQHHWNSCEQQAAFVKVHAVLLTMFEAVHGKGAKPAVDKHNFHDFHIRIHAP